MTRYERTQIGYAMIWASLLGAVGIMIGVTFQSPPHREILLIVLVALLITISVFCKLTITVNDETLRAAFGLGLIKKQVPVADIAACEPIRIRWWYGWGIHLTPYGWLYNVAGWNAVAITLRSGQKFSLGTDDPQGLAAAIVSCSSGK